MFTDTMGSLNAQIATHFVTLGFFCLLLPLVIITPEVRTQVQSQTCVRATILNSPSGVWPAPCPLKVI